MPPNLVPSRSTTALGSAPDPGDATNPYQIFINAIGGSRAFAWFGRYMLTPLDTRLKGSRFAPSRFGVSYPLCYLTTTGAHTGRARISPLFCVPTSAGDGAVVVATNFGRAEHPAWTYNLEADPHAILERTGRQRRVRARRATEEEFAFHWERFNSVWPHYERYRLRSHREPKMFLLQFTGP